MSLPRTRPELEAAGFALRAPNVKCPCCPGTVDIWQQAGKMPVFLDPFTFERHLIVIHVPEKKKKDSTPDLFSQPDRKTAAAGPDR